MGTPFLCPASFASRRCRIQTGYEFRHGVVHKLRSKLRQHILFSIFECRFHRVGDRRAPRRPRFPHEPPSVIRLPRLPNYSAHRQVTNQHSIQIRFSGVVARHRFAVYSDPDIVPGRALILMNLSYNGKVCLVISIQPVQKQTENIVRTYPASSGVGDKLHKQRALFFGVRCVPLAERFADQR